MYLARGVFGSLWYVLWTWTGTGTEDWRSRLELDRTGVWIIVLQVSRR